MKVFISWSGSRSGAIAEELRVWLPHVVQACEPWTSSVDIDAGARWHLRLIESLRQTQFGILRLTSENLTAPCLLCEAGALSMAVDESNLCPFALRHSTIRR